MPAAHKTKLSKCLQQNKSLLAGCQARRTDGSCSKDLNSLVAFRQGCLNMGLGERIKGCVISFEPSSDWLVVR